MFISFIQSLFQTLRKYSKFFLSSKLFLDYLHKKSDIFPYKAHFILFFLGRVLQEFILPVLLRFGNTQINLLFEFI